MYWIWNKNDSKLNCKTSALQAGIAQSMNGIFSEIQFDQTNGNMKTIGQPCIFNKFTDRINKMEYSPARTRERPDAQMDIIRKWREK